ncbi:ATP-binding cassette domain-containing protein [Paracoccus pantotrophus]|uniref:ATP-binding cassette domain-containing protein n=1 Tax=Paracoccus pantotrophus TaxID=82367 RepID=A0A7H9BNX8_PARPN|nr:ATP-binding cassette domain-containing protein [Paracoccus pantotrophus]QLH13017.1 ATP-binding cassette domain-containing protein [Paracoccus pantotrophus]
MDRNEAATAVRPAGKTLISVRGLTKSFGANKVLHGIDLDIRAGEIIVLLGPNGAGKSTFLNIIGGTLEPTTGSLAFDGRNMDFAFYNGEDARTIGIQRVFQELSTFPNLTVAENMALTHKKGGSVSRRELVRQARERMQAFPGNRIPVDAPLSILSIAERQMVEIARAMTEEGTRLVILDEPTSALSSEEVEQLSDLVRRKAAEGVAVIYVTHKLEEAVRLADRVVVLRDGRLHFDGAGQGLTHDRLLELLGATLEQHRGAAEGPARKDAAGADLLTVEGLSNGILHDIRMNVGEGEIVGLAGLEGAGQRELLQAIFDARGHQGQAINSATDIAYVSGDRKREGLLPIWSVQQNVEISAVPLHARMGFVDFKRLKSSARAWLQELGLAHRANSPIVSLSGGNQQRALLGRALASEAPLLLLDDPTRGVDAGAKASIYAILDDLKKNGRSAILYSTEVAEFAQCDRVHVMARGHIVAEFTGAEATEERIVHASFQDPTQGAEKVRATASGPIRQGFLGRLIGWPALPAAVLMLVMFGMAFALQPRTLSTFGLELLLQASIPLAFAVIAQMLFLLGGDIDLGLGFAIGLANVLAATYLVDAPVIGILALAAVIGGYVILAVIVEVLGVSSVVATLGASFVWLGIGLMIRETPGGSSPQWLSGLTQIKLSPLPFACYVLVAVALLGLWISRGWGYSIRLRALGHNRRTYLALGYSALAGRVTLYALAGTFAVAAGLLITGTTGAGNINVAAGFTLSTVAAVVVGGASFAGGLVSPVGAVMAVIGISLINTNLVFMGISSDYTAALGGLVLILALSFRSLAQRSGQ